MDNIFDLIGIDKQNVNFVAIDFETATPNRMACQMGIVAVEDGEVIAEKAYLIQPPDNRYDTNCTRVHGIAARHTTESPTFDQVWPEIKVLIDRKNIVAHNCAFDVDVLRKNLAFYGVEEDYRFASVNCTMKLFGNNRLVDLCEAFGIEINHHDALSDTLACAKLYVEYLKGKRMDELQIKEIKERQSKAAKDVLIQDLEGATNKDNIFYDKKVVFSGTFSKFIDRNKLAAILKDCGADVNTSISVKTDIFITGDGVGPAKMEKVKKINSGEKKIQLMGEEELYLYLDSIEM